MGSLVSAATAREYLPELTGATADATLDNVIARVESAFAVFLGFPKADSGAFRLDQGTYTLYLDGPMWDNREVIALPVRPLVSVASLHSDVDRAYGSSTLIAASEYELDLPNARIIQKPNTATTAYDRGFRALKVVCDAGFSTGSPPAELVHAICLQTALIFRNRSNIGRETISQQGSSVKVLSMDFHADVRRILYPLRACYAVL